MSGLAPFVIGTLATRYGLAVALVAMAVASLVAAVVALGLDRKSVV